MSKLLLLHYHCDYSSNDIWRAAIQNGFRTERIHNHYNREILMGRDYIRYYGNTLQGPLLKNNGKFGFHAMDTMVMSQNDFTKRKITLMKFRHLPSVINFRAFIKPVYEKFFEAKVYNDGDIISGSALGEDFVYVQEPIEILDEIRCFCLKGEILTASYYRKNKEFELENIDDRLADYPFDKMVNAIYRTYNMPPGSVLDFGLTKDRGWVLIEQNEAWASGVYNCNPNMCLKVICESQYSCA